VALFVVLGNALISPTTRVFAVPAPTTTTVEEETTYTTDPPYSQVPDDPPYISVAIMSDSSAVVSFAAPAFEGSSPVLKYVIQTNSDPSTDRDIAPTNSGLFSEEVFLPVGSVTFAVSAENNAGSSGWTESSPFSWDSRNPQVPTVVLVDPQAESVHFPQMLMYGPTYMTICVVPDIDLKFNDDPTSAGEAFAIEPGPASDVIDELNANGGLLLAASDSYYSTKLSMPSNVEISGYAVSDPNDNSDSYCNGPDPFFQQSVEIRPLNIGLKRRQVAVALGRTEAALYEVGDTGPGGGTIFYVDMNLPPGSQYFEAACVGWQNNCDGTTPDPTSEWGCYISPIAGADGQAIGTGEQNTADILAGCETPGIAARLADGYTNSGESDWFLPSQNELNQMYVEPTTFGGFSTDAYWSSYEYDGDLAWFQWFDVGEQYATSKYATAYVRPVRSF
jgi:hypothetical protein